MREMRYFICASHCTLASAAHTWGTGARASQFVRSPQPECMRTAHTHVMEGGSGAQGHRNIMSHTVQPSALQASATFGLAPFVICFATWVRSRQPKASQGIVARGAGACAVCGAEGKPRRLAGWDSGAHPNLDQPPGWLKSRARRQGRTKPRQNMSKWQYPDGARACRMLAVLCVRLAASRCASIAGT